MCKDKLRDGSYPRLVVIDLNLINVCLQGTFAEAAREVRNLTMLISNNWVELTGLASSLGDTCYVLNTKDRRPRIKRQER